MTVRTPISTQANESGLISENYGIDSGGGQKSILEHPKALAIPSDIAKIKAAMAKGDYSLPATPPTPGAPSLQLSTTDGAEIWNMIKNGQDSYDDGQYLFRATKIVSTTRDFNISFSNQRRVYSTNSMLNETQAPTIWRNAVKAAFAAWSDAVPSGHTLGWLKKPVTFTPVAGNRAAVNLTYWLYAWRDFPYGGLI